MVQHVSSNRESGFTLVEFCVATLIMMIGLLGLLKAVNMGIEQNLGTVLRNEAVSVADEQMMQVKKTESTPAGYVVVAQGAAVDSTSTLTRKVRNGNVLFRVDRHDTGMSTKSKEVIVRVSWTYRNKTLDHRVTSLLIDPNL